MGRQVPQTVCRVFRRAGTLEDGKGTVSKRDYGRHNRYYNKKVVIMSAAQVGKTDAMVLNPIGYYVHYDPSPIMVIQPTIDMAEKFSKEKLSPMLRDTPVLADRINEKSRNSGNTIMQKIFPGGFITIAGANSPTGLRSHTIRILLADEIDAYPASAGKEGDPLYWLQSVRLHSGTKSRWTFPRRRSRVRPE